MQADVVRANQRQFFLALFKTARYMESSMYADEEEEFYTSDLCFCSTLYSSNIKSPFD